MGEKEDTHTGVSQRWGGGTGVISPGSQVTALQIPISRSPKEVPAHRGDRTEDRQGWMNPGVEQTEGA